MCKIADFGLKNLYKDSEGSKESTNISKGVNVRGKKFKKHLTLECMNYRVKRDTANVLKTSRET